MMFSAIISKCTKPYRFFFRQLYSPNAAFVRSLRLNFLKHLNHPHSSRNEYPNLVLNSKRRQITKYISILQLKFHFRMMMTLTSFPLTGFLVSVKRGHISESIYRIHPASKQRLKQKWPNKSILQCNSTAETTIATNQNFLLTVSIFDLIEEKQLLQTPSSYL